MSTTMHGLVKCTDAILQILCSRNAFTFLKRSFLYKWSFWYIKKPWKYINYHHYRSIHCRRVWRRSMTPNTIHIWDCCVKWPAALLSSLCWIDTTCLCNDCSMLFVSCWAKHTGSSNFNKVSSATFDVRVFDADLLTLLPEIN